jgi:TolB-like protein/DNA-binding winged helix-turn-helix (wHTH) protein
MEEIFSSSSGTVRFGVFEVDLRACELRKQGSRVRLQEQPYQILRILLEHPGEVVTRVALQQRIWPADTYVDFDHGLNNAVKRLRNALCDSAEQPRYIETLPKRGYRFIGLVNGESKDKPYVGPKEEPPPPTARRFGWRKIALMGVSASAMVAVLFASDAGGFRRRILSEWKAPVVRSIAVIPLQNLSGDPNQEYFADGMTDALIMELSQIDSIKVISRTSTIRYKRTDKPLPEVARELGVDGIVEGTVQRSGDRVRVSAKLIYAPADEHVWAQTFDQNVADTLTMEQDLAAAIAAHIQARLTSQQKEHLQTGRPVKPEALDDYLQGEYLSARMSTGPGPEDVRKSMEYYQRAIKEDPTFTLPYVHLAEMYYSNYFDPNETIPIQKELLRKALEIDPQSAEAHLILGTIYLTYDWNWALAEREIRRSLELNPNSAAARCQYAEYLVVMGRLDEAKEELQRAKELDPLKYDFGIQTILGQYNEVISGLKKRLELSPQEGFLHWELYRVYAIRNMERDAVSELAKTWRSFGFPEVANSIETAYQRSNYASAMYESIRSLERLYAEKKLFMPGEVARQYAIVGAKEKAIAWLLIAYKDRDGALIELKVNPAWDSLRSELGFQELVSQVGLPG